MLVLWILGLARKHVHLMACVMELLSQPTRVIADAAARRGEGCRDQEYAILARVGSGAVNGFSHARRISQVAGGISASRRKLGNTLVQAASPELLAGCLEIGPRTTPGEFIDRAKQRDIGA